MVVGKPVAYIRGAWSPMVPVVTEETTQSKSIFDRLGALLKEKALTRSVFERLNLCLKKNLGQDPSWPVVHLVDA